MRSSQNGRILCAHCAQLLSEAHENDNAMTQHPSWRITRGLAEQKPCHDGHAEELTSRLADTEWLVPQPHVTIKNWERYLSCGGRPRRERGKGSSPPPGSPAQAPSAGERCPITSVKASKDCD